MNDFVRVLKTYCLVLALLSVNLVACIMRGPKDLSLRYDILNTTVSVTNWAVYTAFVVSIVQVGLWLWRAPCWKKT